MPSQDIYAEANRRLHTILGIYLALRAWVAGAEAVVVSRESLKAALDLKSVPEMRVLQLCYNVREFFPHTKAIRVGHGAKVVALVLSRFPLPHNWVPGANTRRLASNLSEAGLTTVEVELPSEEEVVKLMALLTHGFEVSL